MQAILHSLFLLCILTINGLSTVRLQPSQRQVSMFEKMEVVVHCSEWSVCVCVCVCVCVFVVGCAYQ